MMPSTIKKMAYSKNGNVQENIYLLCNVKRLEQHKLRCNPTRIKCMKTDVFNCASDMHVRPMRFSILCTSTDGSDKNPSDVF